MDFMNLNLKSPFPFFFYGEPLPVCAYDLKQKTPKECMFFFIVTSGHVIHDLTATFSCH